MRLHSVLVGLLVLVPLAAVADRKQTPTEVVTERLEELANGEPVADAPKFAFVGEALFERPASFADVAIWSSAYTGEAKTTAILAFPDPTTAWISATLGFKDDGCGHGGCYGEKPNRWLRTTALVEKVGTVWQPIAFSFTPPTTAKEQAAAIKAGTMPDAIKRNIAGAEEPVKLFEASLADPKVFAATVSTRKEVVLYGSELAERYVGGAQVKAQLTAWGLTFKIRDGVAAGISKSKTVAWIAANLDASSAKRPKDKPAQYRAFFIYEKTGAAWKIVQIQFSVAS